MDAICNNLALVDAVGEFLGVGFANDGNNAILILLKESGLLDWHVIWCKWYKGWLKMDDNSIGRSMQEANINTIKN